MKHAVESARPAHPTPLLHCRTADVLVDQICANVEHGVLVSTDLSCLRSSCSESCGENVPAPPRQSAPPQGVSLSPSFPPRLAQLC